MYTCICVYIYMYIIYICICMYVYTCGTLLFYTNENMCVSISFAYCISPIHRHEERNHFRSSDPCFQQAEERRCISVDIRE